VIVIEGVADVVTSDEQDVWLAPGVDETLQHDIGKLDGRVTTVAAKRGSLVSGRTSLLDAVVLSRNGCVVIGIQMNISDHTNTQSVGERSKSGELSSEESHF